ncbi:MAG: recombinase family protein [Clostridia bacterium]|nr:recombinase family protein [Clostridia bacterium]
MTTYGYVRVSSKDQNEDRQIIALREAGVPEKNIYVEKKSGKDFDRPVYKKLLRRLKPNDVLVIKSIDRLGRNYTELQEEWRRITIEKEVDIVVLDMPLLDTRKATGDLTGRFISNLVLQILSYVSEVERDNIKQRQREGIAAAKARGVKFGRDALPKPEGLDSYIIAYKNEMISARKAAAALGISHTTFLRWVAQSSVLSQLTDDSCADDGDGGDNGVEDSENAA